ncbi:hypothetical protein CAOG_00700 [Capsaspora owczarzaki ATCC 30864]|uniref:Signal recognition particle 19 kDa protein n=1 Tax=Capsaspora owczarzaki (strain ATCC 30864) TaxID=595528 RepID=A0A0D2WHQ5_CAPO3|nr:hypothetical protein CAOG_00700 [Capsaspora owczarzaki ATCC 30864]KJE89180.1 hypothetical protein CAOG_000700 [Capsaspora owczarzaki ATCC 30864]|eukprot:XP_004365571.1 hypothetical protein CAOG_00700 [Capsaspora owczarzaki ATCC 30864]
MAHLTTDPTNVARWVVVYPIYINSRKTLEQGRRLGVGYCCDSPTAQEVALVVKANLKLECILEWEKAYPRDFMQRGRVRVQLFDANKKPLNSGIPNRQTLLKYIALQINKIPNRTLPPTDDAAIFAQFVPTATTSSASATPPANASAGGNTNNKKNKKKK